MLCGLVYEPLNIFRLGHVGDQRQHFAATLSADHLRGFVERRLPSRAHSHLRALAREKQGSSPPHPLARAGHQCDFTFQTKIHLFTFALLVFRFGF